MHAVILPKVDVGMVSGTVEEWLKREGEKVEKGEPIAMAMSVKVTYEIPAPISGILYKILVQEGMEVPVGQTIAIITEPDDDIIEINKVIKEAEESLAKLEMGKVEEKVKLIRERVRISPIARKLADEYGLDVTKITGTGPSDRIVKADVLKAAEELGFKVPPLPSMMKAKVIRLTGIRKIIAEQMAYSSRNVPQATLMMEVDMSGVNMLRQALEKEKVRVSYNAAFIRAVASALQEYPILNSTLEGEEIRVLEDINIGMATATERGLMVPVIHKADEKSLTELTSIVEELVEKTRQDKLSIREVTDGTFTITNLGTLGVDAFIAIINSKQAAILAIGKIEDKPQVVDGRIESKPTVTLSLSFDHRIIDGAPAAQFLGRIKQILENASLLLV